MNQNVVSVSFVKQALFNCLLGALHAGTEGSTAAAAGSTAVGSTTAATGSTAVGSTASAYGSNAAAVESTAAAYGILQQLLHGSTTSAAWSIATAVERPPQQLMVAHQQLMRAPQQLMRAPNQLLRAPEQLL